MRLRPLVWPAVVALLLANLPGSSQALPRGHRPNILLITVESLRRDRLGCYAGGGKSTPAIDALATRGVRFERAYAASVSTAPSVATVLTGLFPVRHGLRGDFGGRLRDDVPTIAEALAKAGYRTGAVVGSSHLDASHGLERGFKVFDDSIQSPRILPGARLRERRADEVVKKGLEFVNADTTRRPFFLWLDFYDPHYDYVPPESLKKQFESDPYAGEVAHVDAQIAVLMEGLRNLGLDQTTDVVLVGSHGEGLGDHGETGHGIYLFETTARVPFIYVPARGRTKKDASKGGSKPDKPAGSAPSGTDERADSASTGAGARVVEERVGLTDIAPTLYAMAGVVPSAPLDGRSLRDTVLGNTADALQPRRLFIEAMQPFLAYGWSPMFAVIEQDHKIVQGARLEAFDLAADPGETKPIQPIPEWAEGLRTYGQPLIREAELSEPEKKRILDGAEALDLPWKNRPTCLEKNSFSDPRDRVDLNDRLFRAQDGTDRALVGRAFYLAQDVLQSDPGNYTALEQYSYILVRDGAALMLMNSLEVLQCNYPLRGGAYHLYGHVMEKERKYDKAELALNLFKLAEPTIDDPYYDLACLYAEQDDKDRAFDYLAQAIKHGTSDFSMVWRDPRLANVRHDVRFTKLVGPAPAPAH